MSATRWQPPHTGPKPAESIEIGDIVADTTHAAWLLINRVDRQGGGIQLHGLTITGVAPNGTFTFGKPGVLTVVSGERRVVGWR